MQVLGFMAGVAIFGCALIYAVNMTGSAGNCCMFASQGEGGLGSVVDGGSRPARSSMAA